MGVRPSRHASRVSAADTRDPSVLGSETSALRRAATGELRDPVSRGIAKCHNPAHPGLDLVRCAARVWYAPVDRCSRRQNALHNLSRARAGAASCIRSHAQVPSYDAPSSAACAVRPAAAPGAHTHAPQLPAHGPRCPPALLAHGNHICTTLPHTRIRTRPPHSTVPGPPLCAPLLHKRTTSRAQPTQLSAIAS